MSDCPIVLTAVDALYAHAEYFTCKIHTNANVKIFLPKTPCGLKWRLKNPTIQVDVQPRKDFIKFGFLHYKNAPTADFLNKPVKIKTPRQHLQRPDLRCTGQIQTTLRCMQTWHVDISKVHLTRQQLEAGSYFIGTSRSLLAGIPATKKDKVCWLCHLKKRYIDNYFEMFNIRALKVSSEVEQSAAFI